MKIILIRYHDKGNINTRLPQSLNRIQGVLPPLGIAYIAAALQKDGFEVGIIDAQAMNYSAYQVKEILKREAPSIVGVTTMSSNLPGALEACAIAKECRATVVIGGVQLEIYPEETLYHSFIDFGVIGEGEETFVELARALKNRTDYTHIRGLAYKRDGVVISNGPRIVENIDLLPMPARHLLPNRRYSSIIALSPVTTMISSRGCPYQCGFCFKQWSDSKVRYRSATNIVDEMQYVVERYGVKEIMFYDDTITMNKHHIQKLCYEIINRGLEVKWEAPSRIDTVDEELLRLMKEANCIRLRYGIESGNQQIVDSMNKRIRLQQAEHIFALTKKVGIERFAYFIIGYLGETDATMKDTIKFAKKIAPDLVMFTLATPYPKTKLYDDARRQGIIIGDYWRDFTLRKTTARIPYLVKNADVWLRRAYRSIYFDPRFIFKRLRLIHTFDQFKKTCIAFVGLLFFKLYDTIVREKGTQK